MTSSLLPCNTILAKVSNMPGRYHMQLNYRPFQLRKHTLCAKIKQSPLEDLHKRVFLLQPQTLCIISWSSSICRRKWEGTILTSTVVTVGQVSGKLIVVTVYMVLVGKWIDTIPCLHIQWFERTDLSTDSDCWEVDLLDGESSRGHGCQNKIVLPVDVCLK